MKRAFLAIAVLCLLSLLLPLGLNGQTVTAISGMAINQYGQPSPFASVRVCLVTTGGNPCDTTGVTLYYDYSQGIKAPNPYSADQYGNYSVYATGATTPNVYLVEVTPAPPQSGGPFSYLFNGAGGSGSGGGGVNPSLLPQPLCFYATVGSTCSPTLVGTNLGPAYYPSLGPSPSGALFSPNTVSQLPKIDVRSPNFGIPSGCANAADSSGVLDSTCAINAAVSFGVTVFGSGSTSRPMPCVYIPAGTYLISGPIIMSNQWALCGDGPYASLIVQSNLTSNGITVRNNSGNYSFSPNTFGWAGGGGIYGLGISCSASGTPGGAFNGCTGNAIEIEGTDFRVDNVTITNWGGRGIMSSSAAEQIFLSHLWENATRWPISNVGQANFSLNDYYAAGPGQTQTYGFGAICHLGYCNSTTWNPTTVTITSASVDGSGHATIVVSSSDLTHGYATGFSSPIPPGGVFKLSGITDSSLLDLNGTFQATTITGAAGSPFTITFTTYDQTAGSWAYTDNDEPQWFCGNNVTCPVLSPSLYSASSPIGLFQLGVLPAVNYTMNLSTVVGSSHNLRLDILTHAQGIAESSLGDNIDGSYDECTFSTMPCLQRDYQGGEYIPYTTLTQATNSSGAQTVSVNNASWFKIVTGDPTNAQSISQSSVNWTLYPPDYSPYSSAASCCVSGVNQNQKEVVYAAMDTANVLHIVIRNEGGSTAPSGTVWPIGALISPTYFNFQAQVDTVNLQRYNQNNLGGNANGFGAAICSDTGANICADQIIGTIPNFHTLFALSGGPSVKESNYTTFSALTSDMASVTPQGSGCLKILGGNVDFDGISSQSFGIQFGQMSEGTDITNGIARHLLSACVIVPKQNVNGTPTFPTAIASDEALGSRFFCTTALGGCGFDSNIRTTNSPQSFGGASAGLSGAFIGHQSAPAYDWVDGAVTQGSAAITAWSIPSLAGNTYNLLTLMTNMNPGSGNCVQITGLTVGAIFNNSGQCWRVTTSNSTTTVVAIPILALPASLPLSATESGTITLLQPQFRYHCQGGPTFTGADVWCGWGVYSGTNNVYNYGLKLAQDGTTPGVLDITDLRSTNWNLLGNFNIGGNFNASGIVSIGLLSNLIPNSGVFSAGTWSTSGTATIALTSGQSDPWGGSTATLIAVTGSGTASLIDVYPSGPLVANTNYNACAWIKGAAGGEIVRIGTNNQTPPVGPITTSWGYYCAATNPGVIFLNDVFYSIIISPQSVYLAGASMTLATNSSGYVVTGATPTSMPIASVASPYFYATLSANSGTTLPLIDLGSGTPGAGKYVDGGTGAWTALPGAGFTLYNGSGATLSGAHGVFATGSLTGGTLAVTLTGSSVFTSSSSYMCTPQDTTTPANAVTVAYSSGSAFTLTGTGTDAVRFQCTGN